MTFDGLWSGLAPIGRNPATGGYRRFAYMPDELRCRDWFAGTATARGMTVRTDRNGNLWAWLGEPGPGAVVTGSHLDSVPDGGAFDGPLGVVSAFAAIDVLLKRATPRRPIAVVAFVEEEGARFGIACLGSRLLTGALDADRARGLTDERGVTLAEAMTGAGLDPAGLGRDEEALARIGCYVELHVEQGRGLADLAAPVGIADAIWAHGRWLLDFTGEANHAGTTRLADRHDPMLTFANTVLAARKKARLAGAVATIGRMFCEPNGTNAIPSRIRAWLDARAATEPVLHEIVADIERAAVERAGRDGTRVAVTRESYSPEVRFDPALRERLGAVLGGAPVLPTGAGHDAGILAAEVPAGMLFVRNPTGVSHAPAEYTAPEDCHAGVRALAAVLEELACR